MSKILLMQDKKINNEVLSGFLESKGYNVLAATNTTGGFLLAKKEKPDLIIIDLHITDVESIDIEELKNLAPIICLSSPFMKDREDKGKQLGCIGHINKPIKPAELIQTVIKSLASLSDEGNKKDTSVETVLIVDDIVMNIKLLESLLLPLGYKLLKADNGPKAIELCKEHMPDLILLDVMMPQMDGFQVCEHLKRDRRTENIPIIFVSALDSVDDKVRAFDLGASDYITKPFYHNEVRARVSSALKLKGLQDELKIQNEELIRQHTKLENSEQIIRSLVHTIEAKSPYLEGHSDRVCSLSLEIASNMGLSEEDKQILRESAILHDIGKIGIPDNILNKTGKLSEDEYFKIKEHSTIGENILEPLKNFKSSRSIIRHHHEKLDGSGYPDGIKGDQIDILTRILSVADVYDALSTDRSYRKKLPMHVIRDIFFEEVEKGWWDKDVVLVLMQILEEKA